MTFARPLLLLLLVLPVVLAYWKWTRRGHPVILPFDHGQQRQGLWLRRIVNSITLSNPLLLAVALLFLAGPQKTGVPDNERVLTNIQFCLDVSGSMTAGFGGAPATGAGGGKGARYDGAMQAINDFVTYRKGDAFGLTIFGNEVWHWVPLTKDTSAISLSTPFLRPERLPSWFGGTQIGKALRACRKELVSREEGDRLIILVSDGSSADLNGGRAEQVAAELREDDIIVYAVHVADNPPPGDLYTVVGGTGGEVYSAGDPAALEAVFKHIDSMQKARLKRSTPSAKDHFWPLAAAGLGLVLAQLISLLGLRYTPW